MLFPTFEFWIFFLTVVLVYWQLPHRAQNRWLLAASYFFYAWWDWRFLGLIGGATILGYISALKMDDPGRTKTGRRVWLGIGLAGLLGSLFYFKYAGWFVESARDFMQAAGLGDPGWVVKIGLPVGISFFTFQLLSYVLDVYRRKHGATRHPLDFALYVSFFPQLVAGPIERQDRLQPQLEEPRKSGFTEEMFREGLYHVMLGLFKKVVIADNLAVIANHVYNRPAAEIGFPEFLLGTYAFAFQVYGDFSGYSSIAQGVAKWLGFDLMVNFRHPYLALNPSDFWRRWHISLSSALRDYLYIPLGGSRGGRWLTCRNLMITMLLGGVWHGAAWTFVLWGLFHGLWQCVWVWVGGKKSPEPDVGPPLWKRVLLALLCFHLVCVSWVLFRAGSLEQAVTLMGSIAQPWKWTSFAAFGYAYLAFFTVPLMVYELWVEKRGDLLSLTKTGWGWRTLFYSAVLFLLLFFPPPSPNEFVYFRF